MMPLLSDDDAIAIISVIAAESWAVNSKSNNAKKLSSFKSDLCREEEILEQLSHTKSTSTATS